MTFVCVICYASAVLSQLIRDNKNSLLSPYTPPPSLRPNIRFIRHASYHLTSHVTCHASPFRALLLIYPSVDRLNKYESDAGWHHASQSIHYTSHVTFLTSHFAAFHNGYIIPFTVIEFFMRNYGPSHMSREQVTCDVYVVTCDV